MHPDALEALSGMAQRGTLKDPVLLDLVVENNNRPWPGDWIRLKLRVSNARQVWIEVNDRQVQALNHQLERYIIHLQASVYWEEVAICALGYDDMPVTYFRESVVINPRWPT